MEYVAAEQDFTTRRTNPHHFALPFITLLATFTISTPAATIFTIPRPTVLAALATVFLFWAVKGRVFSAFWQFALAYLLAFIPGTLFNINDPDIKTSSALQFFALLITFCVLATYFNEWLTLTRDRTKLRWIHIVLFYVFVVCLLEICFPSAFANVRAYLYHSGNAGNNAIMDSMTRRDADIYGGRPMVFFSEPSNLAKYLSVIIAAYMAITRCSWRSLFALLLFFVLIRSVSYFYAAPAMFIALSRAMFPKTILRRRGILIGRKLFAAMGVGILLIAAVLYTQATRISSGAHGQDGSLQSRIQLPLQFLFTHPAAVLVGRGITPQDEVETYTLMLKAMTSNTAYAPGVSEAVSSTIILIAGTGLAGMAIFFIAMFLFQRSQGVWLVVAFLVSNFINSGYNAPTTIIPTALLLALMVYQFRLGREDRARSREAANSVLVETAA